MIAPVYILIRTSRRPRAFQTCMDSVKAQSYSNIVTIVHTDDPRDQYVSGDIIIRGHKYPDSMGTAPYNLYCNTLLDSIPDGDGWFMFLDDDDELTNSDVIQNMVANALTDHINVCKVIRWNNKIYPVTWGKKQTLQTECFMLHSRYKKQARWWSRRGGDHYYTRQLLRVLPINWIDQITARAQVGKGYGKPESKIKDNFVSKKITVLTTQPVKCLGLDLKQEQLYNLDYKTALQLEQKGLVKITYNDNNYTNKTTPKKVYNL